MRLRGFEQRWCGVIAGALVPGGTLGGAAAGEGAGATLAEDLDDATWYIALVVRLALWIVWLGPVFVGRGLHTFGALDEGGREAVLESLLKSRRFAVRMSMYLLKLTVCEIVLGDERVFERLGAYRMDGPALQARDGGSDGAGDGGGERRVAP